MYQQALTNQIPDEQDVLQIIGSETDIVFDDKVQLFVLNDTVCDPCYYLFN